MGHFIAHRDKSAQKIHRLLPQGALAIINWREICVGVDVVDNGGPAAVRSEEKIMDTGTGNKSMRVDDIGIRLRMRGEERRITSQHERLDVLCREVYAQIDKHGAASAAGDYLLFMTALDAHMTVEEDIYFPALHGLRPDAGSELAELVGEHAELRRQAEAIRDQLKAGDRDGARLDLDRLARHISKHELAEEDLIARITEGPVADFGHSTLD